MNRLVPVTLLFAILLLLIACGPTITVTNGTTFPVRAIVNANGTRNVLSPSPGESSSAEVEEGAYTVTVIADQEWINYARSVRQYLNEQIKNSDKLTGAQLLEVVRRLKEIAGRMADFERAAGAQAGASCSGRIADSGGSGLVNISQTPQGTLALVCK